MIHCTETDKEIVHQLVLFIIRDYFRNSCGVFIQYISCAHFIHLSYLHEFNTHTRKRLSTKYLDDFFSFTNCKTLIVLETSIESFMIKVFMIWISNHFFISVLVLFKTRRFHTKKRTIKIFQIYHSKKNMFVTSKCTIISMALTLTNKSTRLFCRRSQKRLRIAAFWCFIGANKFLIII